MAQVDRLLELIREHCTTEQIKILLRSSVGNEGVRLSAQSKEQLVDRNLRDALRVHAIDLDRVYDLLRESEENGPQHIFYLRCASKDVTSKLTLDAVRTALLGAKHAYQPNFELTPNAYTISDIRAWGPTKPADWVVKVYGDETRERATGEVIQEGNRILRVFIRQKFRHVLVARWNAPDLLELRVPRDSSVPRIDAWRSQLERTLRTIVPLDRFRSWDLKNACRKLFDEKSKFNEIYRLGDTKIEDPEKNIISFESFVPDSNLFKGEATQAAMADLLKNASIHKNQRVLWLARPKSDIPGEISTLICARLENEVIFSRHQNSRGIDYVTDQLRTFSKS